MPTKGELVFEALLERMIHEPRPPRLAPTQRALELLASPQETFRMVHVTGTNGKTSTARIIESLVRAHGLRTGLFTSPHLSQVNERIMIDGEPIDDEILWQNWQDIQWILNYVDNEQTENNEKPLSYFEVLTILAAACFADAPVDVAVMEVGMGGEWDSTNAIDGEVAVFTPITLEHTERLGNTLTEIANTKSGIIKAGAVAITAKQHPDALAELQARADTLEVPLVIEGEDFGVSNITTAIGGQLLTVKGIAGEYQPNFLPLFGDHQAQNTALAIGAVELLLAAEGQQLNEAATVEGMATVTSPGRLQIIATEPSILVDAAHNPGGAEILAEALTDYFNFSRIIMVFAVMADKDYEGMFSALSQKVHEVILTSSSSERAAEPEKLRELAEDYFSVVSAEADLEDALIIARRLAEETPDSVVLVTGSVALVGETIDLVKKKWGNP